jgi:membrane protease YdiL (CAAX protease family)
VASEDQRRPGPLLYKLSWAIYLVLAIVGAEWIALAAPARGGLRLALFVDPATWWRDLLWGLAVGAALIAFWEVGRRYLPRARELEREIADRLAGLGPSDALALALLSGFSEELFFRGAVQGQWGIWVATLLFALLHTGPGRSFQLWTLFAAVAGLCFGLLIAHLGTLLAPMAAHMLVNGVNLHRLVTRPPHPEEADEPEDPDDAGPQAPAR